MKFCAAVCLTSGGNIAAIFFDDSSTVLPVVCISQKNNLNFWYVHMKYTMALDEVAFSYRKDTECVLYDCLNRKMRIERLDKYIGRVVFLDKSDRELAQIPRHMALRDANTTADAARFANGFFIQYVEDKMAQGHGTQPYVGSSPTYLDERTSRHTSVIYSPQTPALVNSAGLPSPLAIDRQIQAMLRAALTSLFHTMQHSGLVHARTLWHVS